MEIYHNGEWYVLAGLDEIYVGGTWYPLIDYPVEVYAGGEWSDVAEGTLPQDFAATHHLASCPTRRVDLTWSNPAGKTGVTLVLQHSTDGGETWANLTTSIAAGSTSYTHDNNGPAAGINHYRIRYSDESTYVETSVAVECPTR